jgi:hypothetical protein
VKNGDRRQAASKVRHHFSYNGRGKAYVGVVAQEV